MCGHETQVDGDESDDASSQAPIASPPETTSGSSQLTVLPKIVLFLVICVCVAFYFRTRQSRTADSEKILA